MAGRDNDHRREARCRQSGALLRKAGVLAAAVLLAAVAVVTAGELGLGPSIGQHDAAPGTPTVGSPPPGPGLSLRPPPPAPPVLSAANGGPPVSIARLRKQLAAPLARPGLDGHFGFAVSQLGNRNGSWHVGAARVTPASTMKLLTTTAALAALGPAHRFRTSVVRGPTAGSIVLVGGGDPLLTDATPTAAESAGLYPEPASLERLAAAAAAWLDGHGVRQVRLGYDSSLFTGPAVNPHWPSSYIPDHVVSPTSALWVDEGRTAQGGPTRSAHPALDAAEAFRARLVHEGIRVVGPLRRQVGSLAGAGQVAAISSAPLDEIVGHILESSDNEGAEVLLRQVALATHRPASSTGGVTAVRSTLAGLGLDLRGAAFYDGSGLSRQDVLPVRLLVHVLETAAAADNPTLRGVIGGLPVAGFSGTLGYRFDRLGTARDGRGYVRAKTGTLSGVHALAGLAVTRSGQVLVFVEVADKVPVTMTLAALADLDKVAASLSTCGC